MLARTILSCWIGTASPTLTTANSYVIVIATKVKLIVNQRHLCQLSGQDYLDCIPDLGDQAVRED